MRGTLESRNRVWIVIALLVAVWSLAGEAEAQRRRLGGRAPGAGVTRVGGFFATGFGGAVDYRLGGGRWSGQDLDPTLGFGGVIDHTVHRYFALGGITRFTFWRDADWDDRAFGWSLAFLPRGRYPIGNGELYVGVPFGLQVNAPPDEWFRDDVNAGVGWNVQLLFGGQYWVTPDFGLFGELGATWFKTRHDVAFSNDDVRVRSRQFTLNLGIAFNL